MNNLQPTSNREPWIDFAKGITLLLVIIGHTVSGVLSGAIYSFHMPLFFILSGITAKLSSSAQQFSDKTQRSFRRLMFPFFWSIRFKRLFIYYVTFQTFSRMPHSFLLTWKNASWLEYFQVALLFLYLAQRFYMSVLSGSFLHFLLERRFLTICI